jgi:hypothetical protein
MALYSNLQLFLTDMHLGLHHFLIIFIFSWLALISSLLSFLLSFLFFCPFFRGHHDLEYLVAAVEELLKMVFSVGLKNVDYVPRQRAVKTEQGIVIVCRSEL